MCAECLTDADTTCNNSDGAGCAVIPAVVTFVMTMLTIIYGG